MTVYWATTEFGFALRSGFETAHIHEWAFIDANGDGHLDIVATYFLSLDPPEDRGAPIRVLFGDGAGGFTEGTSTLFPDIVPTTVHPRELAVADFNGDGRPDIFVGDHGQDISPFPGTRNLLLLTSGDSGWADASGSLPPVSDFTHSVAAGDIDGDGDVDLVVMNVYGGSPSSGPETAPYVLLNDGEGGFSRNDSLLPISVSARDYGSKYTDTLLFDADGDGDLDLFLGSHGGETVENTSRILLNPGNGDFTGAFPVELPWGPFTPGPVVDATAVDIDGNGFLDLILTVNDNYAAPGVQILMNYGGMEFVDETSTRAPLWEGQVWQVRTQIVDINGDGFLDLLASNGHDQPIFLNDGTGHFIQMPGDLNPGNEFGRIHAADVNGDGRMDLVESLGPWPSYGHEYFLVHLGVDGGAVHEGNAQNNGLMGDASSETLRGFGGDDVIFGAQGHDRLEGGAGNDRLFGGAGDDHLLGATGRDALHGGSRNDILDGGAGADLMDGGGGSDTYHVDDRDDVVVETAGAGVDHVFSTVTFSAAGTHVENITLTGNRAVSATGNGLANVLIGNNGANTLRAGDGDDVLEGGSGDDALFGGRDNDILRGAGGDDYLEGGDGDDTLLGGSGDDTLIGGLGADVMEGRTDDDAYYVDDRGDVVIELAGEGIDHVFSTVTFGAASTEVELITLTGNRAVSATGNDQDNIILGNGGANTLRGGDGDDVLEGGSGNDSLFGGRDDDILRGAGGDDALDGGDGNDMLFGGTGNDTLIGGAGDDVLDGRTGADQMYGGEGVDRFVFSAVSDSPLSGYDRVFDLEADDIIDLSGIDANVNQNGDQDFTLVSSFSGQAGQMTLFVVPSGFTWLQMDVDGDGVADMRIALLGDHTDFDNFLGVGGGG